ncbi:hypothetical protein BH23CHL8_BH23CHL8_26360 [soil metagenome]
MSRRLLAIAALLVVVAAALRLWRDSLVWTAYETSISDANRASRQRRHLDTGVDDPRLLRW